MTEMGWRFRLARLGYNLVIHLLIPLVFLYFLWRSRREIGYRQHLGERFARGAPLGHQPDLWIHAVSLGEMRAAGTLVRALADRHPHVQILLTTITPAGRAEAERMRLAGLPVTIRYLPLDAPILLRRFIRRSRPGALVLVETELWPNLLHLSRLAGLPVVLVNARLSPRLRATYQRFRWLYAPLLAGLEWIAAQGPGDADHFRKLGARRVETTGNLKFDLPTLGNRPALGRDRFSAGHLWIAGSTHPGEEAQLLDVHRRLQAARRDGQVQLLLAPRHPARAREVIGLSRSAGLSVVARSEIDASSTAADVIVLDTLGELAALYALADVAFVGGSLVPHGGQNPLEPIAAGCPVVIGPDSRNFADMVALLRNAGAILEVADADGLLLALEGLLGDPEASRSRAERARQVIRSSTGATAHTLRLLEPLLPCAREAAGHPNTSRRQAN